MQVSWLTKDNVVALAIVRAFVPRTAFSLILASFIRGCGERESQQGGVLAAGCKETKMRAWLLARVCPAGFDPVAC